MKVAIVHDYLNQFGGAERVVTALHEVFPEAPIYTSIYDAK
ncbi:MAG: glycosyltransferase family 4 protein, partial [Candidatus Margulisbacteria bacterium]|nr:glycosyltransferase family 4 protein [Candidatus Margulisiibacteriota bacterium]